MADERQPDETAREQETWIACADELPLDHKIVMTKIDDAAGVRNKQTLKRQGRLWFYPDGSMYVYYTPTHWREV
jgi:hypothetical protein